MFDNFTLEEVDEQAIEVPEVVKAAVLDDGIDVAEVVKVAKAKPASKQATVSSKHAEKLSAHLQVALEQAKHEESEFAARMQALEAEHEEAKAYVRYLQDTIKSL